MRANPVHVLHRAFVVVLLALTFIASGAATVSAIDLEVDPRTVAARSPLATANLLFESLLVDGDRGALATLIADDAVVHSDRGEYTGVDGLFAYLHALGRSDADAVVDLVEVSVVGDSITIRWQLQLDSGTHYGRTLATVEDGWITELWMLNESDLATAEGGSSTMPSPAEEAVFETDRCPPRCDF